MEVSKESIASKADNIEAKILKRLGNFFYDRRTEKNMSVRTLNSLSGVSVAVISDLENAKSMPRIETIARLALALGIEDMNDVFYNTLLDKVDISKGIWGTIQQCLVELDYTKADIHRVLHYLKFLTYIKNNKDVGIIPDDVRNSRKQQNMQKLRKDKQLK